MRVVTEHLPQGTNDDSVSSDGLFHQVFSIPLVLKEILTYLPFRELLRTSLVNKSWNFFSREILRERNCVAEMKFEDSCGNLTKFSALLENTGNVPFSGLSISLSFNAEDDEEPPHRCVEYYHSYQSSCNILSRICVKHLYINYDQDSTCAAVEIIRVIFSEHAKSLEMVSIERFPCEANRLSEQLGLELTGSWLPNVRILECESNTMVLNPLVDTEFCVMAEMIQASPNLRELRGYMDTECLKFILAKNLVPIMKEFHYRPTVTIPGGDKLVEKFAFSNPKLRRFCFTTQSLDFDYMDKGPFRTWTKAEQDEVGRNLRLILASCAGSLTQFDTDQLSLLLMVIQWDIPVMEKVRYMRIPCSPRIDEIVGFPTLGKIDWSRKFPNLKHVRISNYTFPDEADIEFCVSDNLRHGSAQFSCETVTALTLDGFDGGVHEVVDVRHIGMLRNIFPNVTCLYIWEIYPFSELMTSLWSTGFDLERLIVSVSLEHPFSNFDWVFTGLTGAEVGFLYEQIEEMGSLEVVAGRPCLLNLPKLKWLRFVLKHPKKSCKDILSTSDLVFVSHVTGHCAFGRMPNLTVEIHRERCKEGDDCHLALNHLKPFATVFD